MSESPTSRTPTTDVEELDTQSSLYEKLAAKREELEAIAEEDVPFAKDAKKMLALLDELEEER